MQNSLIGEMKEKLKNGLGVAEKLGASTAKLGFYHDESMGCGFESGRLKKAHSGESRNFSVDVVVDGRRGATGGNDLDAIEALVERAVALAKVIGATFWL